MLDQQKKICLGLFVFMRQFLLEKLIIRFPTRAMMSALVVLLPQIYTISAPVTLYEHHALFSSDFNTVGVE